MIYWVGSKLSTPEISSNIQSIKIHVLMTNKFDAEISADEL